MIIFENSENTGCCKKHKESVYLKKQKELQVWRTVGMYKRY